MSIFITASETAEKWRISQRRVQVLCAEGRIPGAFKLGDIWAVPDDAKKPKDTRFKDNKMQR